MALSFTEGSIGGDIERVELAPLAAFYGGSRAAARRRPTRAAEEPQRLERHRHRARADPRRPCLAADQSAHQLLLPLRARHGERRGAARLRRLHLGPVLHLPGVQRARRLDAHVERRRFGRRVRRDDRAAAATGSSIATARRCARSGADTIMLRVAPERRHACAARNFTTYATHHGPIVRAEGDTLDRAWR